MGHAGTRCWCWCCGAWRSKSWACVLLEFKTGWQRWPAARAEHGLARRARWAEWRQQAALGEVTPGHLHLDTCRGPPAARLGEWWGQEWGRQGRSYFGRGQQGGRVAGHERRLVWPSWWSGRVVAASTSQLSSASKHGAGWAGRAVKQQLYTGPLPSLPPLHPPHQHQLTHCCDPPGTVTSLWPLPPVSVTVTSEDAARCAALPSCWSQPGPRRPAARGQVGSCEGRCCPAPSPATPPPPATPPAPAPVRMVASDTQPMSVILSTQGPGCSAPLLLHTSLLSVSTAAEFSLCCCCIKWNDVGCWAVLWNSIFKLLNGVLVYQCWTVS